VSTEFAHHSCWVAGNIQEVFERHDNSLFCERTPRDSLLAELSHVDDFNPLLASKLLAVLEGSQTFRKGKKGPSRRKRKRENSTQTHNVSEGASGARNMIFLR
jgi:hypothetical protein